MKTTCRLIAFVLVLPMLAVWGWGCSFAPAYPEAMVTFDDELLGDWGAETEDTESGWRETHFARVEPRSIAFENGASASALSPVVLTRALTGPRGYTVTLMDAKDPAAPASVMQFDAVLLEVNGTRLLAMQPSASEILRSPGGLGWMVPVHRAFKISRDGDRVSLATLQHDLYWMPVRVLGPEPAELDLPQAGAPGGSWLIPSSDLFIRTLKTLAERPDAWAPASTAVRRSR